MSLVPMLARGEFFFRNVDIIPQQEFLSYPRGKHDDVLDAIYYAVHNVQPARLKSLDGVIVKKQNKVLDWMTL